MKKGLVVLLLLVLSGVMLPTLYAAPERTIAVYMKGLAGEDIQLKTAMADISAKWVVITEDLTYEKIKDATLLIVVFVDPFAGISADELNAIKKWFDEGGKVLWVAGDSDYGDDSNRQKPVNDVLEAVGSVLRLEYCSVEDTKSNAGKPYRVLGVSDNADSEVEFLVSGVERALFHGPGVVVAYVNGKWVALDKEKPANVYRVMWTTEKGKIVNHNPPDPNTYSVGDEGRFVLMAIEVMPDKKNAVIVTGDSPFDHYTGMYKPELKNAKRYKDQYPQQGAKLFTNIVEWALAEHEGGIWEAAAPPLFADMTLILVAVIVIVIVVIAFLLLKRKK